MSIDRMLEVMREKGFTLIELLIVIAIIGILSSFVVASFTSAQAKGRDSRRKSDLDALKKSLELAKTDSTGNAYYPACDTYTANACAIDGTNTNPDLSPSYIKTVPTDPKTSTSYTYQPTADSCAAGACTGFILSFCLENANEPAGGNVKDVEGTVCTSKKQYSVTNP